MKRFPLIFCLSVLLLTACGKSIRLPAPDKDPQATEQKETAKKKNEYLKRLTSLENRLNRTNGALLKKRSKGYNTAEAETTLKLAGQSLQEAKDLLFWDKFEELDLKINEIKILRDKAEHLIKNAPEFGDDRPIKKEKIRRKYLDERDWVKELRGEPDKKSSRSPSPINLSIFNPSQVITSSDCWSSSTQAFIIQNPPNIESWFYQQDQKIYIFMETNSIVEQFTLRNELRESERDMLLAQLCKAQTYSSYKLIYAGEPRTDAHQIVDQLFLGLGRGADMFGVGSLDRMAKAAAALSELSVAAIAFNTTIGPLTWKQAEQFQSFTELMKAVSPEVVAITINLEEEKEFQTLYDKSMAAEAGLIKPEALFILEELKKIRSSEEPSENKRKRIKKLVDAQSKELKRRLKTFGSILNWQKTLYPEAKDIGELTKIFPGKNKEIREILGNFSKTLEELVKEFGKLRDQLMRFNNETPPELVFYQDKPPVTFFLLEGVRFEEKTLPGGEIIEEPDLLIKITVEIKIGKKEPPVFLKELKEIKITNANRFISEVRDYQRLTSFGLSFPANLSPGNYYITFTITDNLRAKTIMQVVNWLIAPSEQ